MFVLAEWVLKGKQGSDEGYRILARSPGAPEDRDADGQLRNYVPGNPGGGGSLNDPAALPWVWFAPDQHRTFQAAIAHPAKSFDAVGRPFAYTHGFWLKADDVLRAKPSFEAIARAMQSHLPSESETDYIEFQLESIDLELIATREDVDRLMRIAALLLESPCVLITADLIPLHIRLAELDAIAAFLPYGFKLDLPVASWIADAGSRIRMGFSRGDLLVAALRGATIPIGSSPDLIGELGRQYYERLKLLADRVGVLALLTHLQADTSERSFVTPESALDWLDELGRPYFIWQDVVNGINRTRDVRELIRSDKVMPGAAEDFVLHLLVLGSEEDLDQHVMPLWSQCDSERAARGLSLAIYACGARDLENPYTRFAATQGVLDEVVASILEGPSALARDTDRLNRQNVAFPVYPPRNPAMEQALARTQGTRAIIPVVDLVIEALEQFPELRWDRTRSVIEGNPALYYDMSAAAFGRKTSPAHVLGGIGIKKDESNHSLKPLLTVIDGLFLDQAELRSFCSQYPVLVEPLLRLLMASNNGDVARDLVWGRVADVERPTPDSAWVDRIDLVFPSRNAHDAARGDVLRFVANRPQANWLSERFGTAVTQYNDQFIEALTKLQSAGTRWRVCRAAINALNRDIQVWATEPWSPFILGFLKRLDGIRLPETYGDGLRGDDANPRDVAVRAIGINPVITRAPEFGWWKSELNNNPSYREAIERAEFLAEMDVGFTQSEVAKRCGIYIRKRNFAPSVIETVVAWVITSSYGAGPTTLSSFLIELGAELARNNVQPEQRRDVTAHILQAAIRASLRKSSSLEPWVGEMRSLADLLELIASELAGHNLSNLERESQAYVRGATTRSLEELSSAGKRGLLSRLGRRS